MFKRELFNEDHDAFRDMVRRFIAKEIAPFHDAWENAGVVPRAPWQKAGAAGLLCCTVPEVYGGAGADYLFDVVVFEEKARSGFPEAAVAAPDGTRRASQWPCNWRLKTPAAARR